MPQTQLQHWSTTVIADKSASDLAQVPGSTLLVDVYAQGMTASATSAAILGSGGTGTLTVYDLGSVQVNSTLKVGTDSSKNFTVDSIDSDTTVTVHNDGPTAITVAVGARLVVTSNRPTLYGDIGGSSVLNALGQITSDSQGYVSFYIQNRWFDYMVTSGTNKLLFVDEGSGAVTPNWVNVQDYATFQDAIDAVRSAVGFQSGTVYVPTGVYDANTVPAVTPMVFSGGSVRLIGDGVGRSWIKFATGDAITISGADFTEIADVRLDGNTTATRGIVIKSSSNCHIHDVWLQKFASWEIDFSDSVGDCVFNAFERVRLTENTANGLVKLSDRAFSPIFRHCALIAQAGRGVNCNQSSSPKFIDCNFENNATDAASADGDTEAYVYVGGADQITIRGAWFETGLNATNPPNNWFIFFPDSAITRGHMITDCRFVRSGSSITSLRAIKSLGSGATNSIFQGLKGFTGGAPAGTDDIVLGVGDSPTFIGDMTVEETDFTDRKHMTIDLSAGSNLTVTLLGTNRRLRTEALSLTDRDALTNVVVADQVFNATNSLPQFRVADATGSKWLSAGVFFGTTAARNALTWTRGDLTWITDGAGPRLDICTVAGAPGTHVPV